MEQTLAEAGVDMPDCLRRVRSGDEDAARLLVRELFPLVMRIVRSHLPRRMEEEDLAQMIFAKVFAHMGQYSGSVPFPHWVSRVAVNTCLNVLRAEKCRPELRMADLSEAEADVLDRLLSEAQPENELEQVAARDLARKMLETLSARDRLILTMLDLEGHSVNDVRERTGWNVSVIKVRAFRARMKLRREFARLWKEERA